MSEILHDSINASSEKLVKKLVEIEKNWILKGPGKSLYVRPFVIETEETVQASP